MAPELVLDIDLNAALDKSNNLFGWGLSGLIGSPA
jgi:hypothetical protein